MAACTELAETQEVSEEVLCIISLQLVCQMLLDFQQNLN